MAAILPDPPIEHEHPRLTSAPIDVPFLLFDFKVKPCPFDDCDKGPDKCPFLHPGEKGRRDPRRFVYGHHLCLSSYSPDGESCPRGDGCRLAHGFLENWLHPELYMKLKYRNYFSHLESGLKLIEQLHYPMVAGERAAMKLILDLERNHQIHGFVPYATNLVGIPVSFNNVTDNDLAMARTASDAIFKHVSSFMYGNASAMKENVQPILVPASGGYPGQKQGLFSTSYIGLNKLFPNHNKGIVAVTYAKERIGTHRVEAQLLSAVDAPPTAGGSSVPKHLTQGQRSTSSHFRLGGIRACSL